MTSVASQRRHQGEEGSLGDMGNNGSMHLLFILCPQFGLHFFLLDLLDRIYIFFLIWILSHVAQRGRMNKTVRN